MRGLRGSCLFLAITLAAACATSSPVRDTSGVGGAGAVSSAGSFAATTGSGAPSCGIHPGDPACRACVNARCCNQGKACGDDPACVICLGAAAPAASCGSDAALSALTMCLQNDCAARCLGSFGATSSSASGGGTGGASASSSGNASAASSSSSANAASSSSSASAASSSSSAASSSSAGSSSSGGPLTCTSVDGNIGCCDGGGAILRYCDAASTMHGDTCTGGSVCGWNAAFGFYDCVAPPGGADPSGTYPLACGG